MLYLELTGAIATENYVAKGPIVVPGIVESDLPNFEKYKLPADAIIEKLKRLEPSDIMAIAFGTLDKWGPQEFKRFIIKEGALTKSRVDQVLNQEFILRILPYKNIYPVRQFLTFSDLKDPQIPISMQFETLSSYIGPAFYTGLELGQGENKRKYLVMAHYFAYDNPKQFHDLNAMINDFKSPWVDG
jgi:hypothetical protein